jgi:hypothetical protein
MLQVYMSDATGSMAALDFSFVDTLWALLYLEGWNRPLE